MQFIRVIPFFLMLAAVMAEREVNDEKSVVEDPWSDIDGLVHDVYEDEEDFDEADESDTPESIPEADESDTPETIPDTLETESLPEDLSPGKEESTGDIGECKKEDLGYFPHRFRDWLYIIMQELPRRKQPEETPLLPLKETEDSHTDRKWVEAVLWKFCDLDLKPRDRKISRDELAPLRDPLVSMEPCIDPFLDGCDANKDNEITVEEWGHCLGLQYDEIEDECKPPKQEDEI